MSSSYVDLPVDLASDSDLKPPDPEESIEAALVREVAPEDIERSLDELEHQFPDKLDFIGRHMAEKSNFEKLSWESFRATIIVIVEEDAALASCTTVSIAGVLQHARELYDPLPAQSCKRGRFEYG